MDMHTRHENETACILNSHCIGFELDLHVRGCCFLSFNVFYSIFVKILGCYLMERNQSYLRIDKHFIGFYRAFIGPWRCV